MTPMTSSDLRATRRRAADESANAAARAEMLRLDGQRSLGENLEQADALIRAAFELANAFAPAARDDASQPG